MDMTGGGGGGLFSAVTGIRRFGDLGKTTSLMGGSGAGGGGAFSSSSSSSSAGARKRPFSDMGRLGSTVAAQQFVFTGGAGAGHDESSQQFSRQHGESSNAGNSNPGSSRPRVQGAEASSATGSNSAAGSLFAQLGAKRGLKSIKSVPTH